jgi:sec-independent protein translocase protein TatB
MGSYHEAFMGTPHIVEVANLGMADSLILMVMALVVFGPRRLPEIGRQIGKLMYEFRKASNDFKFQMEEELRNAEETERRKKEEERLKALALPAPVVPNAELPTTTIEGSQGPDVAAVPSPYPGEEVYPPEIKPAEANPAETKAAAPELRIQPPSIGEQVPAARPWNLEEKLAELEIPGPEPAPELTPEPAAANKGDAASLEKAKTTDPAAGKLTEEAAHNG